MRLTFSPPRAVLSIAAALIALALSIHPAAAQAAGSLAGRVTSAAGAPVADAVVTATAAGGEARRARSGTDGAWRITRLAPGAYTVRVARVGFASAERTVQVASGAEGRVDLALTETDVALAPVAAVGRRDAERERTRFETEAGVTTRVITGRDIKVLPGLGEADVMRAVEVLPGVVTTSDFSSAFNVRGGSSDQNLVLLDGFPIFNPFHLGGLFSVFNSDAVARAELLSGGFGAEYGGRVSSVLNIESKPGGGPDGFGAEVGVSLLATRVALHGNLPRGVRRILGGGDEGGWLISARRSYFDVVLKPVVDFPYHLTDVQGTATLATRGGGRLRLVGYVGQDVLNLEDFEPPGIDSTETNILRIRWNWGNRVIGARLEQPVGEWFATASVGVSHYGEALGFTDFSDTRFASDITQLTARADAARPLGPRVTIKAGGELTRMGYHNVGEAGGTTFFSGERSGWMTGGFGQLRWVPSSLWIVEPGVRVDAWHAGVTRAYVAPRLAAKRFFGAQRDGAVKVAGGRYVQFVHSLRDEQLPVSNDYWITADENVPAVVSDQAQLGIEKYWGERWYASAEAYYRSYRGVTDLNAADDPNDEADDLLEGRGYSYGADLMVRRTQGRLRGWMTLSLLKAQRTFPDALRLGLEGVPEEVTFPPVFDRRVDLDVVGEYLLPGKIEAGLRLNFGSGVPYSRPVAAYAGFETDLVNGGYRVPRPIGKTPEVPIYVVPGDRNRQRYPAYSRLDLTFRRTWTRRWGTFTPYAQVLNATNQKNVLFYFYQFDTDPPTRSGVSMFPVLPTIGFEATF
ncbi:MAG TPA: TonB-dependent receptor [Longimicrobium sp.]|jgi:hypothetical protein